MFKRVEQLIVEHHHHHRHRHCHHRTSADIPTSPTPSNKRPQQPYEPTCGNDQVEPGEECDDSSPCCEPSTCKLVPNAKCSKGPGWATAYPELSNGTVVTGDWVGQCCSDDCHFLSSATMCTVGGWVGRLGLGGSLVENNPEREILRSTFWLATTSLPTPL